ncbi:MAG: Hsp20/alpha crystallin family protein [Solirubrobacterales bacterium]
MSSSRDLFANFERMRREMDELFGDVWERAGFPAHQPVFAPKADVYYCGEPPKAIVRVDLPGVELEAIDLQINGRELVVSGHRPVRETEGRVYQQVEVDTGPFQREIELGAEVIGSEASATYEDGVLRIELPLAGVDDAGHRVRIERNR